MKVFSKTTLCLVLVIAVASCSALTIEPVETPFPTATPVPPTEISSAPLLPIPSGEPADSWADIPVMPNAIAGSGDSSAYSFIVDASTEEIQNFYERELAKIGWYLLASGKGTTQAKLLIFIKGSETVSVSIIPQPDGLMYVMFVK